MKRNTRLFTLLACCFSLFLVACEGEQEEIETQCVDNKEYFQKEVWSKFMSSDCTNCHINGGQADKTDFVLQTEAQTGFIDANITVLRDVASFERDGESIVLLKPTNSIAHDGGKIFEKDSDEYRALVGMIERFDEPVQCGESSQIEEHFSGVELLTPNETFRKATLNVGGRLPTAAEDFRIATGGEEALDAELNMLLQEEPFYERLEGIFNDMFLTDRYLGRDNALDLLDPDYYPNAQWFEEDEDIPNQFAGENQEFLEGARMYTNNSMARENLKLASYLVRNDRPFTEIVTADYMVMNPYTARAYGVEDIRFEDPLNPNEWQMGRIPAHPHSGVLTSPMWLNRFPTTATNRNRHRSRMVYWFFLATDVMKLADRPLDPTNITSFNPTRENANCNVCHAVIDPVAGALQNWNEEGSYQPPAEGWFPEMYQPGFEARELPYDGTQMAATQWLAQEIVNDRRFATAMVHHMYRGLTGQEPLTFPTEPDSPTYQQDVIQYEVQDKVFDRIAQDFIESDYNLRIVFKELIKSKYFRAENVVGEEADVVSEEVSRLGMGRMLTPELLDKKIEATLGVAWADRDGDRYLLDSNEYRLLYGGIDSNDVTTRMTEPNGIMAGIQLRMANEMSCAVTAQDFTQPAEKRRLFPFVEPNIRPIDDAGLAVPDAEFRIKKNIAHMHYHLLGEQLDANDPEVLRTYNLFVETMEEGRAKLASEELNTGLRCDATRGPDGVELPEEQQITDDEQYTIRSWMAVVTYLLADYKFLYE